MVMDLVPVVQKVGFLLLLEVLVYKFGVELLFEGGVFGAGLKLGFGEKRCGFGLFRLLFLFETRDFLEF